MNSERGRHVSGMTGVVVIAVAIALVHIFTNNRYGFHRDELQTLSDALHLDWGFVPYPPFTPFVERIGLEIFGLSLVGLRLFSVIAQSLAIIVTGLMAKELGGQKRAQILAAFAVALSPLPLFEGTEFQYSTFDYLWWVLIAYFVIRLLNSEDARWWVAIGATVGVGLMTKYTMAFYMAGILAGLLLTSARKFLATRWLWIGVALALAICLPNIIWQARHDLISLHFLRYIHHRDVGQGRDRRFVLDQFLMCVNVCAAPLWIAGLWYFFRDRRYRMLAWMYIVPFAIYFLSRARFYYLAAAYPMLIAMGAVTFERWADSLARSRRIAVQTALLFGITAYGVAAGMIIVPVATHGPLKEFALKKNGDLREEIGWNDLVRTLSGIRDMLPADQRSNFGILVGNYGEQGAIEILGPAYGLPAPISTTNSAWLRGYPSPPPTTLIVIGSSRQWVEANFTACRLAGHNENPFKVENEESMAHPDIFVCGPPREPWPNFWEDDQRFG